MEMGRDTSQLYRMPVGLCEDIEQVGDMAEKLQSGVVSPKEFHHVRTTMGIYEQRQDGLFMMRVRLPGGMILPEQMRVAAEVERRHGGGSLHFTTRQDIQVHNVPLARLHPALIDLLHGGLATKGGGSDTVRNVTACPGAGVCPREVFNVTSHVLGVSEHLLASPSSFKLPRKFKVTFSCCSADCAGATVIDVGFIAKIKDGERGFAVYAAGGMGSSSRVGHRIEEFVPESQVHIVAEAVKRVFNRHGNRENRRRARLRFVVIEKGFEHFLDLYRESLAEVSAEYSEQNMAEMVLEEPRIASYDASPASAACEEETAACNAEQPSADYKLWRRWNVQAQKQEGLYLVDIPLSIGDIEPDVLDALATTVSRYGERMLRATVSQDVSIRCVPGDQLPALHAELVAYGLANVYPPVRASSIACTGASTCRLGICLSRGLLTAIHMAIEATDLDLWDAADVRLYVNGCPNSCGRHPIASIGLMGCARRIAGYLVPHYTVQLGGRLEEGRSRLAEGKQKLPARNVPQFVVDYLRLFRDSEQYPDFDAFLDAGGREATDPIIEKYQAIPDFEDNPDFYCDWGVTEPVAVGKKTD